MTFRLQGPFPLDLQTVGASARAALGPARLGMDDPSFSDRLIKKGSTGEEPGLYVLWDDPPGSSSQAQPSMVGFWLTFGPSYVEGGPQEPLDRHPPFADEVLEALTEEVWWQGLRVTPRDPDPRWRPLIVLEWPADLADRSACPPPGVPTPQNDAEHVDREAGGNWLSVDEFEEQATAVATPVIEEEEEPSIPVRRSLIAVIQGDMRLEGTQHAARYRLLHLPDDLPNIDGIVHPDSWLARAVAGGGPPSDAEEQHTGACLGLPGGRVGFALGGWLTAALDVFPLRPAATEGGALLGRDVGSRWKVQARTTASVVTTVVVLVLALAAMVQEFTRPRAHAGPPAPASEAQPALSVCSMDNDQFVAELRCQIHHFGANTPLQTKVCGDRVGAGEERDWRVEPIDRDLQATWCGVRDRDLDGRRPFAIPEEAHADEIKVKELPENPGYADLLAAKACYNVLQHPEDYRLDPEEPDLFHLPQPDRFLDDPVYQVKALGQLVRELDRTCDAFRPRLERQIEGSVVARHVGALAPIVRTVDRQLSEPAQLRQHALIKAAEALPPTERVCLNNGAQAGPFATASYAELCEGRGSVPPPTGAEWAKLGWNSLDAALEATFDDEAALAAEAADDPLAAVLEEVDEEVEAGRAWGDALVDRYVEARFSPNNHPSVVYESVVQKAPDLWKCHMALTDPELPMASSGGGWVEPGGVRVRWDLRAPVPKAYAGRTVGAVTRQLELDAVLTSLQSGEAEYLGACWGVVARRMVRYRPVHPLLPERANTPWPAEEQQLCAQICASLYRVRDSPNRADWFTRGTDLGRCIDQRGPETLTDRNRGKAFATLQVPWNHNRDGTWKKPYPFEVCAFNLVAQDYLTNGEADVIVDGMPAPRWSGETIDYRAAGSGGETYAGGLNLRKLGYDRPGEQLKWVSSEPGGAWQAAMNLESYGRARSSSTCGHAATQCFVSQMLASISSNPDQPHRWNAAWQTRMERLASGEGTEDLDQLLEGTDREKRDAQRAKDAVADRRRAYSDRTQATPWCRLIQPYVAGESGLPEGQLDFPCASGVQQTRQAVDRALQNLARTDTRTAQAGEAP